MKNLLIEKGIVLFSLLMLLIPAEQVIIKTQTKRNTDTVKVDSLIIKTESIIATPEKIDTNAIIAEAKKTMEEYNKSVAEKNKQAYKLIKLTSTELANSKKQGQLINDLIKKINAHNKLVTDNVISEVKKDSICNAYTKPLFGKAKCKEYLITYYILKDNERIDLFTRNNLIKK